MPPGPSLLAMLNRLADPLAPAITVANKNLVRSVDIRPRVICGVACIRGPTPGAGHNLEDASSTAIGIGRSRIQAGLTGRNTDSRSSRCPEYLIDHGSDATTLIGRYRSGIRDRSAALTGGRCNVSRGASRRNADGLTHVDQVSIGDTVVRRQNRPVRT